MALKENIILLSEAVKLYENGDLKDCLEKLNTVNASAKIRYNQGIVNIRLHEYDKAIECLSQALQLDSFMSVAYFQRGLLYYNHNMYDKGEKDMEDSLYNLRDSLMIDYKQLGLCTKIHRAQILYNLCVIKKLKGDVTGFEFYSTKFYNTSYDTDLFSSVDTKLFKEVVDLRPPYNIFCPPKGYVSNLLKKDFLGKSEVVSSVQDDDFSIRREQKSTSNPTTPVVARKNHLISTNNTRMAKTPPPLRPPPRLQTDTFKERDENPKTFSQLKMPQRSVPTPAFQVQTGSKDRSDFKSVISENPQRQTLSNKLVSVISVTKREEVPVLPPPLPKDCDIKPCEKRLKPERPPPPRLK